MKQQWTTVKPLPAFSSWCLNEMHAVEMPHGHALQFVLHTTCCDTDLDRSKPKVVVKENSDCFKGTLKCHIKKNMEGKVKFCICCASTECRSSCRSLWLPERELPPVKGDMVYLYFVHWHRGGGTGGLLKQYNRLWATQHWTCIQVAYIC